MASAVSRLAVVVYLNRLEICGIGTLVDPSR